MKKIHVSQEIHLDQGYSEYEIDSERDLELNFTAEGTCDVFLKIVNAPSMRIRTFAAAGAKVSFLYWNSSNTKVVSDETYEVLKDAHVTAAYGECGQADTERKTFAALREPGASALISSASLVSNRKNYHMDVASFAPHTYGDIKNYAVMLNDGNLLIDAIGRIAKGAYRSESHQTSRALSFDSRQKAEILPELLIDEDDVQASHAMSIGRVDEDSLYYMMSRGLSVKQCTSLISTGYLMPITETLNNEELKQTLREEMERKIGELCLM
ncbi:MAG: SufD family Fe-S cluster assembly protein [Erysipelotrichia bacterium]|nr:SufD family Fe-S cluster assembly protein [Erysipelotrichia bacterium]